MHARRLIATLATLLLAACGGGKSTTGVGSAQPTPNRSGGNAAGTTGAGVPSGSATGGAGTFGGTSGGSGTADAGASGATGGTSGGSPADATGATGTAGGSSGSVGGSSGSVGSSGSTGTTGVVDPNADRLTAGAWDDNANFDFYLDYLASPGTQALPGLPQIPRSDRLQVAVTDGAGHPVPDATVTVTQGAQTLFVGQAGADGLTYVFPAWLGAQPGDLSVTAEAAGLTATATAHAGDPKLAVVLPGAAAALPQVLDLALVLDTTGSMGDELGYLQLEIANIAADIQARYPNVQQRYALVLYRDSDPGEEYAVRSFDFTTDLPTFQSELNSQSFGGGADYEERPELGLNDAMNLQWSSGAAARVLFHVADAPTHVGDAAQLTASIQRAYLGGVRIYPVAASGTDDRTEFSMRTEAEVTGGRYLFLTDDSGVGDPHAEPHIPCYFVTSLRSAILRMVSMELSGQHLDPDPGEVIRTGGNPQAGRCTLSSGQIVVAL